jgi:hypothetical protein
MYSSAGSGHADEGVDGRGEGYGSSMELGEGSEGQGVGGMLRGRAERLERARRLLDGYNGEEKKEEK